MPCAMSATAHGSCCVYGPGYRVYFMRRGMFLVMLLCGGDKRTQQQDIEEAKRIAAQWKDWAMAEKFTAFDAAEYQNSDVDIAAYLDAAQADAGDDAALMAMVLSDIARARNMSQLEKDAGLTRAGLYKALSPDGNPRIGTLHVIAKAMGLKSRWRSRGDVR